MKWSAFSLVLVLVMSAGCDQSSPVLAAPDYDALAERVMASEQVPGMAVGIWRSGEPVLLRGYGVTNINAPREVDDQTLFKLASTTKAFTSAALALLVERGELRWDSRVVDFLPEFALADPWIAREFRVEDLLTHRSGLGPGAGDLMLWPQPNHFTRGDIVRGMRHLPIPGRFRADYAYDNLLYIVAGELIAAVSGQSYEAFVQTELLDVMGLHNCYAGLVPAGARGNLADPHIVQADELTVDDANVAGDVPIVSAAAGGMHCSAGDVLRWLQIQLAGGVTPEGERVFSEASRDRMWRPVTLMPLSDSRADRDHSHFYAYALGWRVQDMYGQRVIHHTGTLSGMYAWVALIPDQELAMVVLMNQSAPVARQAMIYSLLMPYLGGPQRDWLAFFERLAAGDSEEVAAIQVPESGKPLPEEKLAGVYRDAWFGEVEISMRDEVLQLRSRKSPRLTGTLSTAASGVWRLTWDDRTLHADAWLVAHISEEGGYGFTLQPLSQDIDFSYDFQDLKFERIEE